MAQEEKLGEQRKGETSFYRASAAADSPAQRDTETTMNANKNLKSGNTIEQQLSSIHMSEQRRAAALHDAFVGELIADAIVWVCRKLQRPHADIFATPNFRYWD